MFFIMYEILLSNALIAKHRSIPNYFALMGMIYWVILSFVDALIVINNLYVNVTEQ